MRTHRIPIRPPGAITREGLSVPQLTAAITTVLLAVLLTVVLVIIGAQPELTPQLRIDEAFRALQEGTR
jgi:hypothetical protein